VLEAEHGRLFDWQIGKLGVADWEAKPAPVARRIALRALFFHANSVEQPLRYFDAAGTICNHNAEAPALTLK
jgi:hypothetical protein